MNYSTLTVSGQLGDKLVGEWAERSLYEHFRRVIDRRKLRGRRYEAAVVLTLLVLAKLAGEKKISGIAHWVRLRGGWLSEKLLQGRGRLPCVNTYRYVLTHIDEKGLETEVHLWRQRLGRRAAPERRKERLAAGTTCHR